MGAAPEAIRTLLEAYWDLTLQSQAMVAASIAVAVLFVISFLFSVYTLWLRARNAVRARAWARREARWTDLTLGALTGERAIEAVAEQVSRGEELPFLDFLLRYARRVRGEERDRIRELAIPFLDALEPQLEDRDPYVRARAVQTLGTLGLTERADELVRAVDDESPFVAMLAARALALYGGARYMTPVLANLDRFEQWGFEYVTSLLVSLGPEAAAGLREMMEDAEQAERIRAVAAAALTRLHDLGSVAAAVRTLGSDPPPDVTTSLLRLLAALGGTDELGPVRSRLDDPHFAVRAEAYSAFGALVDADGDSVLGRGLDDPSPWVVLHAARALRGRGADLELHRLAESDHPGARAAGQVLAEA